MISGDLSDLSSMTAGALGSSFFDSIDMPDSLEMPHSSADIQLPAQWDQQPLRGMDAIGESLSIPSLGHDPWASNGSTGSSRLMTWGLGGLGNIGAAHGDGIDRLAVPSDFDKHAPDLTRRGRSGPAGFGSAELGGASAFPRHAPALTGHSNSGPSSLGGVPLGAPGDRNVTSSGEMGGARNRSTERREDIQDELNRVKRERDELKMQEELQRVRRERDELEKRLREMEAAKPLSPVSAPASSAMPPADSAAGGKSQARSGGAFASEGRLPADKPAGGKQEPRKDDAARQAATAAQGHVLPSFQQKQKQQQPPPPQQQPKGPSKKSGKAQQAAPAAAAAAAAPAAAHEFILPGAELRLPDFDLPGTLGVEVEGGGWSSTCQGR